MGFCTDEEYWEFMRTCPELERMLVRDGIHLRKYWFSVSDAEQERRFQQRSSLWIISLTALLVGEIAPIRWCQSASRVKVS
jgi:Polyphosphate kinase 2 (PPK2)